MAWDNVVVKRCGDDCNSGSKVAMGRGLVVAQERADRLGSFTQDRAGKGLGQEQTGNTMGGGQIGFVSELIGQVRQVRNVPVVMVERRAVEDRNGISVLLKQKFN